MRENFILNTDSYKHSHPQQYPPDANAMYSYIEARESNLRYPFRVESTVFFGLQAFVKEYLLHPISLEDIDEAEALVLAHGEPFYREGWEKIVRNYGGYLPVRLCAVPEGTRVPLGNVMATVECDDPELFWTAGFVETAFLRAIWYPTTVATISRVCKDIICRYLRMTCDDPAGQIPFKLHDFGARGASSNETAGLGGMAHLVNFQGTDTVMALVYARRYYGADMAGFSIPAAEHSTITAWGRDAEVKAYENMLRQFARPGAVLACVSDSYDIYNAVEKLWGEELRQQVIDSGATIVIRPDSGNPLLVTGKVVELLGEKFGYTVNKKGYKVLNNVRIIQGDGVNPEIIDQILKGFMNRRWSAENIAFGMGGALLQKLDRDTFSFAMKCSAIRIGEEWREVYKEPIAGRKKSKKGRFALVETDGKLQTLPETQAADSHNLLEPVYEKGRLLREQSFEDVRERSNA